MRCLEVNKSTFYYALYEDRVPINDEYGNRTGEYEIIRGKPQKFRAYFSPSRGEAENRLFGGNLDYDRTITLATDTAPPIDEYTVLWVDTMPVLDSEGNTVTPYDFVVKRVAKSMNQIAVAISKVKVRE